MRTPVTAALDTEWQLATQMERIGIVPVLVIDRVADARAVADVLAGAGCRVLEITLRTEAALDAIAALAEHPSVTVGAGTVLSADQAREACAAGAAFLVAPGFDKATVEFARSRRCADRAGHRHRERAAGGVELRARVRQGLPGEHDRRAGGPAHAGVDLPRHALHADRRHRRSTISPITWQSRRSLACGGTWLASASAIAERDFDGIARRAATAVAIARQARSSR